MKALIIILFSSFISFNLFSQPGDYLIQTSKIQLAILFDGSNSMDGLIDQAKSRIWNIVNEVSSYKSNGQNVTLEIALYEYGNTAFSPSSNYIKQLVPLTSDLDLISQNLFGIKTNGGEEYCGAVISQSINDLGWSKNPSDLKMIYIAGNEPFNQGPIDYKSVMKNAKEKSIYINTIYCGPYNQGKTEFWFDGAQEGNGDYFAIDSDQKIQQIVTPYDTEINSYNDSLNKTYIGYGSMGNDKKMNQSKQDENAASAAPSILVERTIVKSKKSYNNASWDLVDAVELDGKDISEIKEEELPEDFKGKSNEEKKKMIEQKVQERDKYQQKINQLAVKRNEFIEKEKLKSLNSTSSDDFGTSINNSIESKAKTNGFEKIKL